MLVRLRDAVTYHCRIFAQLLVRLNFQSYSALCGYICCTLFVQLFVQLLGSQYDGVSCILGCLRNNCANNLQQRYFFSNNLHYFLTF